MAERKPVKARLIVAMPETIRELEAFAENATPVTPNELLRHVKLISHVLAGIAGTVDDLILLVGHVADNMEVSDMKPLGDGEFPETERA